MNLGKMEALDVRVRVKTGCTGSEKSKGERAKSPKKRGTVGTA